MLVVTRDDVIPNLRRLVVAPVTTRVRGLPTEVELDESDGLRETGVALFDNLGLVPSRSLTTKIGAQICRALSALTDC